METKIKTIKNGLKDAKRILYDGGLVAFPTETVYGLGANALDDDAVKSIFIAKGRPQDNPLIVHLSSKKEITKYVKSVNDLEKQIINTFMPGPITLVLEKNESISNVVTAGLNTVGIRIPENKVAHKFLKKVKLPVAAPSANTSKRPSPTNALDVFEDMNGKISLIIDGGSTDVGVESTVIRVVDSKILLLRPGKVNKQDLEEKIGCEVIDKTKLQKDEKPESPGMKYTHYAPKCDMVLVISNNGDIIKKLSNIYDDLIKKKRNPVILCSNSSSKLLNDKNIITLGNDSNEACSNLFSTLRIAEKEYDYIICEFVEGGTMEDAFYNRASKSSGGNIL